MQFSVTPALTSTQWMKYLPKSNASVNLVFVSFSIPFQLNCCFSLVFFLHTLWIWRIEKKNATRLRHVQLNFIRKLARNWNGCSLIVRIQRKKFFKTVPWAMSKNWIWSFEIVFFLSVSFKIPTCKIGSYLCHYARFGGSGAKKTKYVIT